MNKNGMGFAMRDFTIPDHIPEKTILTFGYTGVKIELLDAFLAKFPQVVIIDTRANPWSRNPIWIRQSLASRYIDHYKADGVFLGNTRDTTVGGNWLIRDGRSSLEILVHLSDIKFALDLNGQIPMFMCAEECYQDCHRRFVARAAVCDPTPFSDLPIDLWTGFDILHLWSK